MKYDDSVNLSDNFFYEVIKTHEFFLLSISSHFDKHDLYLIKNLPDNFNQYTRRLSIAFHSLITVTAIDDESECIYNDDLENILKFDTEEISYE